MVPFHTNDSRQKTSYIIIIKIINIFVVINQINKHKVKIYNHCTYTKTIIKKFYSSNIKKNCFGKYKNGNSIIKRIKTNSTN